MTACELRNTPDVEIYFYGELDTVDRLRVERHVRGCADCRQRLDDLHAIRAALAARPAVQAPPAGDPSAGSGSWRATSSGNPSTGSGSPRATSRGDWSGFMRRLDAELTRAGAPSNVRAVEASNLRTLEPARAGALQPATLETQGAWNLRTVVAFAAMLALATFGVAIAMRSRPAPAARVAVATPPPISAPTMPAPDSTLVTSLVRSSPAAAHGDRALREGSLEHLERSKLVVLGLATRDPHARVQDWQYERALAGTLLTDTRLYRQAAIQGGATDMARVMRDLETVLLEASMSDRKDAAALERVQRLIAKRDLLVKMQVMATAGPAGN
jgi:hypothetical protein